MENPKSKAGKIALVLFITPFASMLGMWIIFFGTILTFGWFVNLDKIGTGNLAIVSYLVSCILIFISGMSDVREEVQRITPRI